MRPDVIVAVLYFVFYHSWPLLSFLFGALWFLITKLNPNLLGWGFFVITVGVSCEALLTSNNWLEFGWYSLQLMNVAGFGLAVVNYSDKTDDEFKSASVVRIRIKHQFRCRVHGGFYKLWFSNTVEIYSFAFNLGLLPALFGVGVTAWKTEEIYLLSIFTFMLLATETSGGVKLKIKERLKKFNFGFNGLKPIYEN